MSTKELQNKKRKDLSMPYRHDIDGLRALAVICVVIYHSKFNFLNTTLLEGGYIGVDIFFVISGFLISRLILVGMLVHKNFILIEFLERRARRIFPLLFLVIFTSGFISSLISLPTDFITFFRSAVSSIFFYSNIYFYYSTTEYGADSSLKEPLLHTWSLGVEEQFYIIFPLLTILLLRIAPKYFGWILLLICAASICYAQQMAGYNADLNFYLPFSRFWELGLGAFVAHRTISYAKRDSKNDTLSFIGVGLIFFSVFYFDDKTYHPGFVTLLPVIGTCLLLQFLNEQGRLSTLLSNKFVAYLGRISFSIYLWHFPLFAFMRQNGPEPSNIMKLLLIFLTFCLSIISYRYIEQPFRNSRFIPLRPFLLSIILQFFIVALAWVIVVKHEGFPSRFKSGWMNYELDDGKLRQNFWKYYDENLEDLKSPSPEKINVYIFGNSHAGDLLGGLLSKSDYYDQFKFLKVVKNEQISCFDEDYKDFQPYRDALYASDAYKKSELFVIASRFVDSACDKSNRQSATDASGLRYLIPKLLADGKKVIVMGNTLALDKVNGQWIEEWIYRQAVDAEIDFRSREAYFEYVRVAEELAFRVQSEENLETNRRLEHFSNLNNLPFFNRQKIFCSEVSQTCETFSHDGSRLRYDYGHLTQQGKLVYGDLLAAYGFKEFLLEVHSEDFGSSNYVEYQGSLQSAKN